MFYFVLLFRQLNLELIDSTKQMNCAPRTDIQITKLGHMTSFMKHTTNAQIVFSILRLLVS